MFTLIKREIEDNVVYFIAAALFAAIIITVALSLAYTEEKDAIGIIAPSLLIPTVSVLVFGFAAMGAGQMGTDKARKVSSFLTALPVSRSQILIARIVTGVLAILVLLVPLVITASVLLRHCTLPYPLDNHFVVEIFTTTFLICLACYSFGLQIGWSSSKVNPILSSIVVTVILFQIVIIKGFGLHSVLILLLFIIACLLRTWQKFISTAF